MLICLDGAAENRIRTDFESICDRFTFRPADDRSSAPGMAMVALDRFVTAAEASGAASAWSIGAIPLGPDGGDVRWMHYEEAVDDIPSVANRKMTLRQHTARKPLSKLVDNVNKPGKGTSKSATRPAPGSSGSLRSTAKC